MQPKKEDWGKEPAGGWTTEQTAAWERENKPTRQQAAMESARAAKAVAEFIKGPEAVSKKAEEAIKHLGVGPNRHSVEKLAVQVVAYRIESRKTNVDSAAGRHTASEGCVGGGARHGGEVRGPALRK